MAEYILYWLVAANMMAFVQMVLDTRYAEARMRRTPASTLLPWAFLGGAFGTALASRIVRHNTRKQPSATWLLIWLWTDIILLVLFTLGLFEPHPRPPLPHLHS